MAPAGVVSIRRGKNVVGSGLPCQRRVFSEVFVRLRRGRWDKLRIGYSPLGSARPRSLASHHCRHSLDRLSDDQTRHFCTKTFEQASGVGNSAFYAPGRDLVQMLPFEAFRDKEGSYATALPTTKSEGISGSGSAEAAVASASHALVLSAEGLRHRPRRRKYVWCRLRMR